LEKQKTGAGAGAVVAVVMTLVALSGFCVIAILGGCLYYLARSTQPAAIAITPAAPKTPTAPTPVPAAPRYQVAKVRIGADSSLKLDGKPVDLEPLRAQLLQMRSASPTMLVVQVMPDDNAPYRAVNDVAEWLEESGFSYSITAPSDSATEASEANGGLQESEERAGAGITVGD